MSKLEGIICIGLYLAYLEPENRKKESQPIAKVMSEQVKMPVRHFLRCDYLYLCYRLAFFFSSMSAKLNQKISHICQVQSDADNSFEF